MILSHSQWRLLSQMTHIFILSGDLYPSWFLPILSGDMDFAADIADFKRRMFLSVILLHRFTDNDIINVWKTDPDMNQKVS